ncbi:thiolase C-terminal domain-containing protein, partial [Nocardiopsis gilva]|uniref:thiolase C-terminal domain-containing protein n=1 Tax=Nocardiopsis gilva TaxID=280236 RepID=UPI00036DF9B9
PPPAVIAAAAQGSAPGQMMMTSYYSTHPGSSHSTDSCSPHSCSTRSPDPADDMAGLPAMGIVAEGLWRGSGLKPRDIQTAVLYDHFTPFVLVQLEELGFCGRGEARDLVAEGGVELGGRLPVNTHGGQLGEAYIHGMNGIAEAVRQVRGTAANQVDEVTNVLVTAGTGVPTSGLILSRD